MNDKKIPPSLAEFAIGEREQLLARIAELERINAQIGDRYRNTVTGRSYRLTREWNGVCTLEGIDRREVDVSLAILDSSDVWEKLA